MKIETIRIEDDKARAMAFEVIRKVYFAEKNWISEVEAEIPEDIASSTRWSWFLTTVNNKPAGVLRLQYDPSLELPKEFQVTLDKEIDLAKLATECKFVEIGRFMIMPRYRKNILVALRLMRAAAQEVLSREYTHFITDVFEGEANSPLGFHTRVLGFEVVGRHLHGELNCQLTRIILTLDIVKAYSKLRERRNRFARLVTDGIQEILERKLPAKRAVGGVA